MALNPYINFGPVPAGVKPPVVTAPPVVSSLVAGSPISAAQPTGAGSSIFGLSPGHLLLVGGVAVAGVLGLLLLLAPKKAKKK